jgi:ABC-2 type transport system ATP-binding protein
MSPAIVEIKNVTKIYRTNKNQQYAVNNLTLRIPRGSFFGLLGPNGAGKSTTIHCLTGITAPTSGSITIDGVDVVKDYKQARVKVGLSPQEYNVDIFATPEQLIDFMGGYYGIPYTERKLRIDRLIQQFDLQKYRHTKFQMLSGGLKRRTMLARALIHIPEVLILDEPTAGVDVEQRRDVWKYLQELNKQGTTIILTSHYLEEIQYLCNDIAIINHGSIVWQGKKEELMSEGKTVEERYLEITSSN